MKLVRFIKPMAQWTEPGSFVRQNHPAPYFYGWLQFRLFLYVAAGAWAFLEIARLNPESPLYNETISEIPAEAIGFALLAIYCTPLIGRISPSHVRLYANFLVVSQGLIYKRCCAFPGLAGYQLKKSNDGFWILNLSDVFDENVAVAISTEQFRLDVERALSNAKVPKDGLPPPMPPPPCGS